MTGIERLRQMAEDFKNVKTDEHCALIVSTWRGRYIDDAIADIADQIAREQAVRSDEIAESFRSEVSEAYEWVREHGGLDAVKAHWSGRVPLLNVKRMVELNKKKRDRLKAHALWLERKCHERRGRIKELNKLVAEMRPRLMPEGMEWLVEAWPRFEDGEPVKFGEEAMGFTHKPPFVVDHITIFAGGEATVCAEADDDSGKVENFVRVFPGECVKRPSKVLDADGAEIEVGDDLYSVEGGLKLHVSHIDRINGKIATGKMFALDRWADPSLFTHRAPVLAADGRPLREGETVYLADSQTAFVVDDIMTRENGTTVVHLKYGSWHLPQYLTHERPDSWERLEEDVRKSRYEYWGCLKVRCSSCPAVVDGKNPRKRYGVDDCQDAMQCDLVLRAKALAERDAK